MLAGSLSADSQQALLLDLVRDDAEAAASAAGQRPAADAGAAQKATPQPQVQPTRRSLRLAAAGEDVRRLGEELSEVARALQAALRRVWARACVEVGDPGAKMARWMQSECDAVEGAPKVRHSPHPDPNPVVRDSYSEH